MNTQETPHTGRIIVPDANFTNETIHDPKRRLGRLPLKTTRKALHFSTFFDFMQIPRSSNVWNRRKPIDTSRTYGNTVYGDCTRAKQAYAIVRMERLETGKTIEITDQKVIDRYIEMSNRRYGGGDNGAYEDDALADWRNPETTIRDTKGRPHTIDFYLRINALNHRELRAGIALSGAKGIPFCINLPYAFVRMDRWDVPKGQPLTGKWMPGSWGGHSMWGIAYEAVPSQDEEDDWDLITDDTWGFGPRRISSRAVAAYVDEAHLVVDSVNAWRKKTDSPQVKRALGNVVDAVNAVSAITIKL